MKFKEIMLFINKRYFSIRVVYFDLLFPPFSTFEKLYTERHGIIIEILNPKPIIV